MTKYISLDVRLEKYSEWKLMVPEWEEYPTEYSMCRVWTGYRQEDDKRIYEFGKGYGRINFYINGGSRKYILHRVALVLEEIKKINPIFNWENPADRAQFFALYDAYSEVGLTVDHICNCRPCFNTNHLCWASIQKQLEFRDRIVAKKIAAGKQNSSLSLRPNAQENHWLILEERSKRDRIKLKDKPQDEAYRFSVTNWIKYIRSKQFKSAETALWEDG